MENSLSTRRWFLGGIIVSIGSVLLTRTASSFPRGTAGLVTAATRLLRKFGVSVAAMFDTRFERDVLTFMINPLAEIQYDQIVNAPNSGVSCWITSSLGNSVEFVSNNPPGQAEIKIMSQAGESMIEIFNPRANVQIMVGDNTYELQEGMLVMLPG